MHRQAGGSAATQLEAIGRADRSGRLPLSFAQTRLWFLEQLTPGDDSYNVPGAVRISGVLDIGGLRWALDQILCRHEALRTRFRAERGVVEQVIGAETELALEVIEVGRGEAVEEYLKAEARRPFDLVDGPLIRAKLLKLAGDEHILVLVMHHIISDGWSLGVFIREASLLYNAYSSADAGAITADGILPELPIQYADYSVWQREWLSGAVLAEQLAYLARAVSRADGAGGYRWTAGGGPWRDIAERSEKVRYRGSPATVRGSWHGQAGRPCTWSAGAVSDSAGEIQRADGYQCRVADSGTDAE